MATVNGLTDEQLRALYAWIDAIPLSRPKRNIARDFSDGVLLAEVIAAYFPSLVELHNYGQAHSAQTKIYNFETLNQRVLRKLGFQIPRQVIEDIVNCKPAAIENVLNSLQYKMAKYREKKLRQEGMSPSKSPEDKRVSSPKRSEAWHDDSNRNHSTQIKKDAMAAPKKGGNLRSDKGSNVGGGSVGVLATVDEEILLEKEQRIRELEEKVEILELKNAKLEQLVRLKDSKIQKLLQGQQRS